ncbi:hypothetical protein B6U83_01935 [Thermoplasmatales archaeon ex4484_36]|nr:MAG: hypothetical protein B6U83_01935 [Thermoplasmatales archaeon ex4484_36]RLF56042.1 MAG: hypothetical protein DRN28_01620 [Thermoplasmata archaeon]RLF70065.1 MAG: hypothetical protein DRN35_04915 [Thermoplasmata archaeon]RLF72288.1 MAG: hypothetical protein DRN40_00620 [Thermoplasmata archaeon]RLF73512.1 MAG: hypothetical protein DRN55_03220 [Thermoplasmata archaeon]
MQVLRQCGGALAFSPYQGGSSDLRVFGQVMATAVGTCHFSAAAKPLADINPEIAAAPLAVGIHIPFTVIAIRHHLNTSKQRDVL